MIAPAAAAIAVALAPIAAAAANAPSCVDTGASSTQCQTAGNAQINAAPPAVDPLSSPYFATTYGPFFGYDRGHT